MTMINKTTLLLGVMVAGIAAGIFVEISTSGNIATTNVNDNNLQQSAQGGEFSSSDSPISPTINKEQWHKDPFASLAEQIKNANN